MRIKLAITILTVVAVLSIVGIQIFAQPPDVPYSEKIDSFIQEEMERNQVPGVSVVIVENNEIVYLRGFGKATSEQKVKLQTPFIIGSMTKAFTALAVMQLVEAGKIDLDAPIIEYLSEFSLAEPEITQNITVRQLLNQTSGIPNLIGLLQLVGGERTIKQAVDELSGIQPISDAGDRFQYSNTNYTVLGLLIETVSGQSYGEYINENIFKPLNMLNSSTSYTEAELKGVASGYRRYFGLTVASELPYWQHSIPSGLIISTAEDMTHFLIAHLNDGEYDNTSILSPTGIATLHTPVGQSGSEFYGMGWVVVSSDDTPVLWHHGSTANFHSTMLIEPDTNRGIVILTNVSLFQVWHLGVSRVMAEGIASILRDQPPTTYGLSIGSRYIITNILIALITGLIILFISLIPWWRRRLADQVPQTTIEMARRAVLPISIDLTWPLIILIAFPSLTNIPSWSFWLLFQPDLGYWLIGIASITLCKAIIRILLSYRMIRLILNHITSLRLFITALVVEIIFFVIFLLVMFLSIDPATFVIGLLVASLLLESIAFPVKLLGKQTEITS